MNSDHLTRTPIQATIAAIHALVRRNLRRDLETFLERRAS